MGHFPQLQGELLVLRFEKQCEMNRDFSNEFRDEEEPEKSDEVIRERVESHFRELDLRMAALEKERSELPKTPREAPKRRPLDPLFSFIAGEEERATQREA